MSADASATPMTAAVPPDDLVREAPLSAPPRAGWRIVAMKEFADHLLSARFVVLILILGLASIVPLYLASAQIRDQAPNVSDQPAVFLALFILGSPDYPILRLNILIGLLAPLLGLAFSFDGVNGERAEGTLPRLLSQPIHRDDVINGKFAAGLIAIGLVLVALTGIVAGVGIYRLGIVPAASEVLRVIVWLIVTIVYVGFWLALGTLLSVIFRRAATSALVGFGVWLVTTFFGSLIASLIGGLIAPTSANASPDQSLRNAQVIDLLNRALPSTQYSEIAAVILNPRRTQVTVLANLDQYTQAQQQIPTLLPLEQSLLLVWPQLVALVALMVIFFTAAYILFMRQEVRA